MGVCQHWSAFARLGGREGLSGSPGCCAQAPLQIGLTRGGLTRCNASPEPCSDRWQVLYQLVPHRSRFHPRALLTRTLLNRELLRRPWPGRSHDARGALPRRARSHDQPSSHWPSAEHSSARQDRERTRNHGRSPSHGLTFARPYQWPPLCYPDACSLGHAGKSRKRSGFRSACVWRVRFLQTPAWGQSRRQRSP